MKKITTISLGDAGALSALVPGKKVTMSTGQVVWARLSNDKKLTDACCAGCIIQINSPACHKVNCSGVVFEDPSPAAPSEGTAREWKKATIWWADAWWQVSRLSVTVQGQTEYRVGAVNPHDKTQWSEIPPESLAEMTENPLKNWCRKNGVGVCTLADHLGLGSWYHAAALWRVRVLHPETFQAVASLMGIAPEELTRKYENWHRFKDQYRKTPVPVNPRPAGAVAKTKI